MTEFARPPCRATPSPPVRGRPPDGLLRGSRAARRWEHAREATDEAEQHYDGIRERFEAEHGKIVDDYWSKRGDRARALLQEPGFGAPGVVVAPRMGDLAAGRSAFSSLLLHTARESVRASNVLSG